MRCPVRRSRRWSILEDDHRADQFRSDPAPIMETNEGHSDKRKEEAVTGSFRRVAAGAARLTAGPRAVFTLTVALLCRGSYKSADLGEGPAPLGGGAPGAPPH